jgi:hypothetical protein
METSKEQKPIKTLNAGKIIVTLEDKVIYKLLDYLIDEVTSAGGDGDCVVLCKCYDAFNLAELLQELYEQRFGNEKWFKPLNFRPHEDGSGVTLSLWMEAWVFTNNLEEKYPDWIQCVVKI